MFRTLRVRLIAMYVLMAVALVLLVATAGTAFSLSRLALGTNDTLTELTHDAPEVTHEALAHGVTLRAAAPEIARKLLRHGVRIVVMEAVGGAFVPLAFSDGVESHAPATASGAGEHGFERPKFPFRLNVLLGLRPRFVDIPGGKIALYPDPRPLERAMSAFWVTMIPVVLSVVFFALLFGRYIADQALRPLMETTESLRCFAAGDFTPRSIATTERNEIAELVTAYNGAAAQVVSAFNERTEAEKEMRQFIADASHELRTPLTVIMGFIDVLRRRANGDAPTLRIYDTMQAEGRRMKTLVEKLIVLAHFDNPREHACEELDVGKIVSGIVASFEALRSGSHIASHIELDVLACAYENEVHEIVGNLLENALKYAPDSPVDVIIRAEGEWAIIEVVDHGPGVSAEDREHVFDRFYRGKNRGEEVGFGLGLAIVKRAVERMGGRISLESVPGKGCRFTVALRRSFGKKASPLVG